MYLKEQLIHLVGEHRIYAWERETNAISMKVLIKSAIRAIPHLLDDPLRLSRILITPALFSFGIL